MEMMMMMMLRKVVVVAVVAVGVMALGGGRVEAARVDVVDPFVGTGGVGYGAGSLNPGPQVPFGLFRVGPDTTYDDDVWTTFQVQQSR
jgi:putative alpha-1,2-mannosidase